MKMFFQASARRGAPDENGLKCVLFGDWKVAACVAGLLGIHSAILGYSATRHSPTVNEPGHLVAGLAQWEFGRFDVYCVTPPLIQYVAAFPVLIAGYNEAWGSFDDTPGSRPELAMGEDFIKANYERSIWLFTVARWACIPFSLVGGFCCYCWSRELWGSSLAGVISVFLWCFEPNILAHAEMITSDTAASAFGLGAGYLFWRWLKAPSWGRACAAGAVMGLALLSKTSWTFLFALWPSLWAGWQLTEFWRTRSASPDACFQLPSIVAAGFKARLAQSFIQLAGLLLIALGIVNLGYGFSGSFTRLKEFKFVSSVLTGLEKTGDVGNRFQDSWLRDVFVPLPKQYVLGIDIQNGDFEHFPQKSYLRGEWKWGGWWYYYIYGLAVKTPHSLQLLSLLAIVAALFPKPRQSAGVANGAAPPVSAPATSRDLAILLAPAATLLVLVSSQVGFNHHVRYVLPTLGFFLVFMGATATRFTCSRHAAARLRALPKVEYGSRKENAVCALVPMENVPMLPGFGHAV
jgi:hypothetical protein